MKNRPKKKCISVVISRQNDNVYFFSECGKRVLETLDEKSEDKICTWKADSEGGWGGDCGARWEFFDGTPKTNGVKFCHRCGKRIKTEASK